MPKTKRTAEEVCIAYARAAQVIRELTAKIKPWECTKYVQGGVNIYKLGATEPIDVCLQRLFEKRDEENESRDDYENAQEEIEADMCARCLESLRAVRDRKKARVLLGAAKRAVEAIGKRLEADHAR